MTPVRAVFYFGTHGPGTVLLRGAGVRAMPSKCGMNNASKLHRVTFRALRVITGTGGMVMITKAFLAIKLTKQAAHVSHDAPRFLNQHAAGGFQTERTSIKVRFKQF